MPPHPHFTWLHLAPLRSFSFAYRPAPIMFFLRYSLNVPPEAFPFTCLSTCASREPLYILFLPFPSIHSILSFSCIGTTFSFSFSLFSFLLLCHYLILLAILFLFLLVSFFFFCCFTTLLFTHAPVLRTLSSPLVLLQPPPPNILIDRSCIRAQRVALWYRLNSHLSLPY